ncbi:MAG TPA: hypothetical protein VGP19_14530 [Candidatus Acidoferrales bacterium]|jgi:hypothetical protein|nr:hypothetical protein [Candidatus Acidoferrales bacterium]
MDSIDQTIQAVFSEQVTNEINSRSAETRAQLDQESAEFCTRFDKEFNELHQQFVDKVQEDVSSASAAKIAEALSKRILVVRPTGREEIKTGTAVVAVRQATGEDIRRHEEVA